MAKRLFFFWVMLLTACAQTPPRPVYHPDAAVTEAMLRAEAADLNVRIVYGPYDRSITTRWLIMIAYHEASSPKSRARVLAHELQHARQYKRYPGFMFRYAFSEKFRIRMEEEAFGEELKAATALGFSEKDIEFLIKAHNDSLCPVYLICK